MLVLGKSQKPAKGGTTGNLLAPRPVTLPSLKSEQGGDSSLLGSHGENVWANRAAADSETRADAAANSGSPVSGDSNRATTSVWASHSKAPALPPEEFPTLGRRGAFLASDPCSFFFFLQKQYHYLCLHSL
jgi:hypothetical protein